MFATFQSNSLKRLCWDGKGKFLVHLLRKILSDCQGECDLEANENEENLESSLDSEEEEADFTALTNIWSRRRSVRPPRRMEDFF